MEKQRPEAQEWRVERVRAVDLDRTIIDTDYFHGYMLTALWDETGIEPAVIETWRDADEAAGITFHTDLAIKKYFDDKDEDGDEMLERVFARTKAYFEDEEIYNGLFFDGAQEFITNLGDRGEFDRGEAFFLTYGSEPLQLLKLRCARLDQLPYWLTAEKEKGTLISNCYDEETSQFQFALTRGERIFARFVELYDDKAPSFIGLPLKQARGFLMRLPGQRQLASQEGDVPENVTVMHRYPTLRELGGAAIASVRQLLDKK